MHARAHVEAGRRHDVEVLGGDTPAARAAASAIIKVLNGIFNEYHKVSLEALRKLGKRPARQALEKIEGMSRFAVDYCMLTSLHGHAIPLTEKMTEYLKPEMSGEQMVPIIESIACPCPNR